MNSIIVTGIIDIYAPVYAWEFAVYRKGMGVNMFFRRIGKDMVRCILTEQDMIDNGLEVEDFFKDKEKVQGFLENIVEQAREEVGYEMKSGMLALQVMPLPNKGLAITFSENSEQGLSDVLSQIKEIANDIIAEGNGFAEDDTDEGKVSRNKKSEGRLYCFDSMDAVMDFSKSCPVDKVAKSTLYRLDRKYYMVLKKGKISRKVYDCISFSALEYGKLVSDDHAFIVNFQEHNEPVIKKNTIGILKKI